jgi:hypothetical protein
MKWILIVWGATVVPPAPQPALLGQQVYDTAAACSLAGHQLRNAILPHPSLGCVAIVSNQGFNITGEEQ